MRSRDQRLAGYDVGSAGNGTGRAEGVIEEPAELLRRLDGEIGRAGGELTADPEAAGAIGVTMFDLPGSEDNSVVG